MNNTIQNQEKSLLMRHLRINFLKFPNALTGIFIALLLITPLSPASVGDISDAPLAVAAANLVPPCSNLERLWNGNGTEGEWCVYTYNNDLPDRAIWGYENIYHASAWRDSGKWYIAVGGWKNGSQQGWHDRIFRLATSDVYGIANYTEDQGGAYHYIGNDWETNASSDCPTPYYSLPPVPCPVNGKVNSYHTVQPDMFSMKWTRPRPSGWDCCDTMFYSYDFRGMFPEVDTGVHYAWVDPSGNLQRGGMYGDNNPLLRWHSGTTPQRSVTAVSDARVAYDPTTQKFYMAYDEWSGTWNGSTFSNPDADISIARSNWTNLDFSVVQQDVVSWQPGAVNPQIVVVGNGPYEYYLFYTHYINSYSSEIRVVKSSGGILGNYNQQNARTVLKPPINSPYKIVGTPYVFCNTAIAGSKPNTGQWQMYFSAAANDPAETSPEIEGQNFPLNNQIFTAFLKKDCEYNPNNPTAPPVTPPVW